jgi:hypothetical protein
MHDIIKRLMNAGERRLNDLYVDIIENGKFGNYLTRNKFYAIISKMEKRGMIVRTDNRVSLGKGMKYMPPKDILLRVAQRWPVDITNGLE